MPLIARASRVSPMPKGLRVLVHCRLTPGVDWQERVFWVRRPDGRGEIGGVAYVGYCLTCGREPFAPGWQAPEADTPGYVEGFVKKKLDGGLFRTQLPDGVLYDLDPSVLSEFVGPTDAPRTT